MFENLEHIAIIAKNRSTKALADWYCKVLGFKVTLELKKEGRPPVYFLKLKNGSYLEIIPPNFPFHLGFPVDNFEKAVKELASEGIALENIRVTSKGWKEGFFNDPEGNKLQIIYRPKGTPTT